MIPHGLRCEAVYLIDEAIDSGAGKTKACEVLEISVRTYQRWCCDGGVQADDRPSAIRTTPSNALTKQEKDKVLETPDSSSNCITTN